MVIKWCVEQKTIEFPHFVLGFDIYNVRAAYIHYLILLSFVTINNVIDDPKG
mgnify:CR=1 FL=1